jgi:hypothetical protein
MQFAPSSYTPTPAMITSTSHRGGAGRPRNNMANEIMSLVDEHLAWQVEAEEREQQRRGSVGTLIIDWDGTGEGYAFHRGEDEVNRLSAGEAPRSSYSRTYPPSHTHASSRPAPRQEQRHPAQVPESTKNDRQRPGYDAPTRASKARACGPTPVSASTSTSRHNASGSVVSPHQHAATQSRPRGDSVAVNYHSNRTPTLTRTPSSFTGRPSSDFSVNYTPTTNTAHGHCATSSFAYEYNGSNLHVQHDTSPTTHAFHIPVERYLADKQLPAIPEGKNGKVLGFVKKVMGKLEKVGVLGNMKGRRERGGRRESWAV